MLLASLLPPPERFFDAADATPLLIFFFRRFIFRHAEAPSLPRDAFFASYADAAAADAMLMMPLMLMPPLMPLLMLNTPSLVCYAFVFDACCCLCCLIRLQRRSQHVYARRDECYAARAVAARIDHARCHTRNDARLLVMPLYFFRFFFFACFYARCRALRLMLERMPPCFDAAAGHDAIVAATGHLRLILCRLLDVADSSATIDALMPPPRC